MNLKESLYFHPSPTPTTDHELE
jgi:chromosome segregation ATPase